MSDPSAKMNEKTVSVVPWDSLAYRAVVRHYDEAGECVAAYAAVAPIDASRVGIVAVLTTAGSYRLDWVELNPTNTDPRAFTSARVTQQTVDAGGGHGVKSVLVASAEQDYHPGVPTRVKDLSDALRGMSILLSEAGA